MRTMNMIKHMIICLVMLNAPFSLSAAPANQEKSGKYDHYILQLDVGMPQDNPYWATPTQMSVLKNIRTLVGEFYDLDPAHVDALVSVHGATKIAPDTYFTVISAGALTATAGARLSACPSPNAMPVTHWSGGKWLSNKRCKPDFLAIVNIRKHTFMRLYNPKGPNSVAQSSNNQYGCYQVFPASAADLNLNEEPDVFFVGGQGGGIRDAKNDWSTLTVFSSKTWQRLFSTRLSFDAYTEYGNNMYQYVTVGYLYGEDRIHAPKRAHREYAKLFFKDFNKNGKLDILIWRRVYKSRKVSDPVKGYELTSNTYEWYEQSGDDQPFMKKSISSNLAEKWLKERELGWADGYPKENLCNHLVKGQPFFNDANELNDPMIEEWANDQH